MKKIFKEKLLFAALFFLLGIFSVLSAQWVKDKIELQKSQSLASEVFFPSLESFFEDDFTEERLFKGFRKTPLVDFQSVQDFKLEQREDDQFIYYEISLNGLDQDKLDIKVENGQVAISGVIEKKSEDEQSQSIFQSQFSRSFPAPFNTDANRVQIENERNKVILKFPKV